MKNVGASVLKVVFRVGDWDGRGRWLRRSHSIPVIILLSLLDYVCSYVGQKTEDSAFVTIEVTP
jgi:hypothetical protein